MIASPYFWIALLIWSALVGGTGYYKGSKHATTACEAAKGLALAEAVKRGHAQGVEDMQIEAEKQKERVVTRTQFVDRIVKVKEEINANPSSCTIPESRRLSINSAIDAANSKISPDAGKMPAPVKDRKQ